MSEQNFPSNEELRNDLETGLLKSDLSDLTAIGEDALELGLDALLDDGILKDIPIVGVIAKVYSGSSKIYAYRAQKNILSFFQEYSKGSVDDSQREKFLAKFNSQPKYRKKFLDVILLSLAHFTDAIQARVLANLLAAHVNGHLKFSQLVACEFALEKLNPVAYEYLNELSKSTAPFTTHHRNPDQEALLYSAGIASRYGSMLSVSQMGKDLFFFGIEPLLQKKSS